MLASFVPTPFGRLLSKLLCSFLTGPRLCRRPALMPPLSPPRAVLRKKNGFAWPCFRHSNATAKCPQAAPKISHNGILNAFKLQNEIQNGTQNNEKSDIAENVILQPLQHIIKFWLSQSPPVLSKILTEKMVSKRKARKNRYFKVPRAPLNGKKTERLSNGSRKGTQMKWEASAK